MARIPVLAVVGPTASGKTALAVELALRLNGEVVSADSMQIYRGMDIASAKPTTAEMRGVPHHMLSILSPETPYSVASYVRDAAACIRDIHSRGKTVILAGGTGLYVDNLLAGTAFVEVPADAALRKRLEAQYENFGGEAMLQKLAESDEQTARRLHANDKKRIVRALEVLMQTGEPPSRLDAASHNMPSPYAATYIGLNFRDRAVLYDRIDRRVDDMLAAGLLDEARAFFAASAATAAQAIGYKELKPFLDGELPPETAVENLKRATRRYAKRQITWFKRNEAIHWLYPDACPSNELFEQALDIAKAVTECPTE